MSQEFRDSQNKVLDLFCRQDCGADLPSVDSKPTPTAKQTSCFTGDLWEETRKRHCDSRIHVRTLLDRHLRPHH